MFPPLSLIKECLDQRTRAVSSLDVRTKRTSMMAGFRAGLHVPFARLFLMLFVVRGLLFLYTLRTVFYLKKTNFTTMSELIRLFRDHAQGRINMKESGNLYYVFGEVAYVASTPTSLKTLDNNFYTLESIVNLWQHREITHSIYVREVSQRGITAVTLIQRRHLLDYLSGKTEELQDHDPSVPIATPTTLTELNERLENERGEPKNKRPRIEESGDSKKHDDSNKDFLMDVDGSAGLSDKTPGLTSAFSADQIAQMRNKVQRNRKSQVKQVPILSQQDDTADPLANFPFEEAGDSCTKALQECELPSSSRIQLYSCVTSFDSINGYFTDLKNKQIAIQTNGRSAALPQGRNNRQPVGYSRYDQEVFHSEPDADFQIETNLSFHGTSFNAIRGGNLNSTSGSANETFPSQANDFNASADSRKRNFSSQPVPPPPTRPGFGPPTAVHPNGRPPKRISRTPIIIIPASGTALITMYNAVDILQGLRYVPTDQRKKEARRESDLVIHRTKSDGSTVPYRVIDDPRKLRDEEWDRIVAVFVQGPAWQFKGWKYGQQPTEIFARICAFHLKFDEQPLDKNIAGWSVKVLSLSQQKRHLDRAVLHTFWNTLDAFMVKNKAFLRF